MADTHSVLPRNVAHCDRLRTRPRHPLSSFAHPRPVPPRDVARTGPRNPVTRIASEHPFLPRSDHFPYPRRLREVPADTRPSLPMDVAQARRKNPPTWIASAHPSLPRHVAHDLPTRPRGLFALMVQGPLTRDVAWECFPARLLASDARTHPCSLTRIVWRTCLQTAWDSHAPSRVAACDHLMRRRTRMYMQYCCRRRWPS